MNYSHNYYKLNNKVYTTIRKSKKSKKKGTIEKEYVNDKLHHTSLILNIETVILDEIPESVLIMDCLYPNSEIDSREKCYELFQSFYIKKINFSKQKWYLFLMYSI